MQKSALGIALPFIFVFGLILSLLLVIGGGAGANACTPSSGNGNNQNASAPAAAPVTNIGDRGDTIKTYLPELQEASRISGFPISLIAATIHQESGWDPNIVSGVGAQGLAQFMPGTWASFGNGGDPFNPHDAIPAMGRYMAYLKTTLRNAGVDGDEIDNVLRAYNAGPGAVMRRTGGYNTDENNNYAPAIKSHWQQYQTLIKDLGIDDYPTGAEKPSLSNVAANKATPESTSSTSASAQAEKKSAKKASDKDQCKDNKNQKSSNAENQNSGNTDNSGDDYPWKNMAHCDAAYTSCPSTPDPTNALPRECVAFAAWRVVQQTGGNADNITFHSPGNAAEWRGYWIAQGWEIGDKPVIGAVVYYNSGVGGASSYGHVAIVKEIRDDGTIVEEGYNGDYAPNDHQYYTRVVPVDRPSAYLYIPSH
ncbi:transglycosylase SLT domain-containing protein [uncultured Rothia sp.]|uniref:transglycosylase SLT domain-containing protein n=1 Tax=uncultured Rothia sp. TaxID=316088 RepID=UPI0028D522CB|nr:transglycosylase SLT domain-containing protein [uncultured Rothia sp.]